MSDVQDTSAPDTTPAPAPTEAAPSTAGKRAERRARAEAMIATPKPTPPAPAESEARATPEPAAEGTAAPTKSKLEAIKEKLASQAQARAAKDAEKAKDDRLAKLEEKLNAAPSQPSMSEFLAEFDRDPIATLRKHKLDPRKYLDVLTKDAISPGSIRQQAEESDTKTELQKFREEVNAKEKAREEAEQARAYAAEQKAIVAHTVANDESKARWGLLAKLPETRRLDWIMTAYHALAQAGHDYDRELTLDAAEALIEEDYKHWSPTPEPKPTPSPTQQSQVAARKPAKTLTPAMAAPSGSQRPKTRTERKEALVAQLERSRSRAP